MTLSVRFLPDASDEYNEAVDFHEARRPGLGYTFIARIREVLDRARANPKTYPVVYGSVRQAIVRKFPYIVLYQEDPNEIVIVAVFHCSRDPSVWKARVP